MLSSLIFCTILPIFSLCSVLLFGVVMLLIPLMISPVHPTPSLCFISFISPVTFAVICPGLNLLVYVRTLLSFPNISILCTSMYVLVYKLIVYVIYILCTYVRLSTNLCFLGYFFDFW